MTTLIIDAVHEAVTINGRNGDHLFRHQWFSFYALLVREAACSSGGLVTTDDLRRFPEWLVKARESVGKEVARHLRDLKKYGAEEILRHQGKTKAWQISIPLEGVAFLPSKESVFSWVAEREIIDQGTESELGADVTPWLFGIVHALVAMQEGRASEALTALREAKDSCTRRSFLYEVAEILELRVEARRGNLHDYDATIEHIGGGLGSALEVRRALPRYLHFDLQELPTIRAELSRLLGRLHRGPDVNGLGLFYNALGLTSRRQGDFPQARKLLGLGIAYSALSVDLPTLQAATFNYGHCLALEYAKSRAAAEKALPILELDREVSERLHIGQNTAQGEIVLGLLTQELGRIEEATEWTSRARALPCFADNPYDQAGVAYVETRLAWARVEEAGVLSAADREQIISRLSTAIDLYGVAGHSVPGLRGELADLRRGKAVRWHRTLK